MTPVKIASWHLSDFSSRGGQWHLLCGRWVSQRAETAEELPGDQRTCERCAVIAEQRRQKETE